MPDFCRLCLGFRHVNTDIYSENNELSMKIITCLPFLKPIQINCLPNKICDYCIEKIESIHSYFNIVISSDKKLQSLLASGLHDLNTFYHNLQTENLKEELDTKYGDFTSQSIKGISETVSISKYTQTGIDSPDEVINDFKVSQDDFIVYIKKDSSNGDTVSTNHYTELNGSDLNSKVSNYDSEDDKKLINFVIEKKVESNSVKKTEELLLQNEVRKNIEVKSKFKQKFNIEDNKVNCKITEQKDVNCEIDEESVKEDVPFNKKVAKVRQQKKTSVWFDDTENNGRKWQCLTCFDYLPCRMDLLKHYKEHGLNRDKSKLGTDIKSKVNSSTSEQDKSTIISTDESEQKKLTDENADCMVLLDSGSYMCRICQKEYATKRMSDRHWSTHQNDRPYACNLCGTSYKLPYDIMLHSRVHNAAKPVFCKIEGCDYSTVYNTSMNTHMKKHKPIFKYTCDICQKGFDVLSWFEEHQNVHTGVKPFSCEDCGKCFIYSRYLHGHRKNVHKVATAITKLVHKCETCPAKFDTRRALRTHFKTHTGTQIELCDICGKGLANKTRLKFHKRIHLDVKPYICGTCNKGFVKKCQLTLHERKHTGERPYVCPDCGKSFVQRFLLAAHQRSHSDVRQYKCDKCDKDFLTKAILLVHLKSEVCKLK